MDPLIEKFIEYVEQNYKNRLLDLQMILEALKCTRSCLYDICEGELELPPMEYVENVRLHQALESLFFNGKYIWSKVGIGSSSTFLKIIKRKTGYTLRQIKNKLENCDKDEFKYILLRLIWNDRPIGKYKENIEYLSESIIKKDDN